MYSMRAAPSPLVHVARVAVICDDIDRSRSSALTKQTTTTTTTTTNTIKFTRIKERGIHLYKNELTYSLSPTIAVQVSFGNSRTSNIVLGLQTK